MYFIKPIIITVKLQGRQICRQYVMLFRYLVTYQRAIFKQWRWGEVLQPRVMDVFWSYPNYTIAYTF